MTLVEIENLSYAELKARRAECIESARKANAADVAERFVDARTDAKQRDEALAGQGATITALNQGLAAATDKANGLEKQLAAALAEIEAGKQREAGLIEQCHAATEGASTAIAALRDKLTAETARADRLKACARAHHAAVTAAAKHLNDALAAQTIDTADKG